MTSQTHDLIEKFNAAGQGQVFDWFDSLDESQQQKLLEQASSIDLEEIQYLNDTLVQAKTDHGVDLSDLEPAPFIPLPSNGGDSALWMEATAIGEQALRDGRVAAFTVAGGQGTRLGYDGPKGTFPVTPIREATLFQVFAEKILAARQRYGSNIPWFIMTSVLNHEATEAFFQENDYFGLEPDSVYCFRQGLMPAVDLEGKIMLAAKDEIAMTPDGHGGSLRALVRSGATKLMAEAGIDVLSYFQVDNPLVSCVDPSFIGFHLKAESDMSSKMLPKAYPKEKVGNFCMQRGSQLVIEYSDMPDELCEQRNDDGQLSYLAGSIAIHVISRDFVERMGGGSSETNLPFHRADKKIATVDANGKSYKPETPNGVKFEMFVFDALPFAKNAAIIETAREDEFSPVKNAEGVDSPQSCKEDQLKQFARWFKKVGIEIPSNDKGVPTITFEISPLFADTEVAFVEKWSGLDEKPSIEDGLLLS